MKTARVLLLLLLFAVAFFGIKPGDAHTHKPAPVAIVILTIFSTKRTVHLTCPFDDRIYSVRINRGKKNKYIYVYTGGERHIYIYIYIYAVEYLYVYIRIIFLVLL